MSNINGDKAAIIRWEEEIYKTKRSRFYFSYSLVMKIMQILLRSLSKFSEGSEGQGLSEEGWIVFGRKKISTKLNFFRL